MKSRLLTFSLVLVSITFLAYILFVGRTLLIPLIIAIFLWNLLNTLSATIRNLRWVGPVIPNSVCLLLSLVVLVYLLYFLAGVVTNNVNEVINLSPRYKTNLMGILHNLDEKFNIKVIASVNEWLRGFNIKNLLLNLYSVFTSITSNALLITLYVIFLFLEQRVMRKKLAAIFEQKGHFQLASNIINQIVSDTQTYIGIKSLLSIITALASWLIMKKVGLDFAEFWAILIFFLNFIPNIGSIIATMFPAALAVVQFQTWWPFSIITGGIILIQFIMGNIVEPRLMGNQLNLSPLVILISLSLWGALWGILGMFLSVPITVMMMIIFSHFKQTEPVAILLSQDGSIRRSK